MEKRSRVLQVRVKPSTAERITRLAEAEQRTVSDMARVLLGLGLAQRSAKEPTMRVSYELPPSIPVPESVVVQDLQAAIDNWQPKIALVPDPWERPVEQGDVSAQRDFYGKPLLPGYTREDGTWWAVHERRPRMWIGERDADGNPLIEGGA